MSDLTAIYYTANRIPEMFGYNIRKHLLETLNREIPLISVSQVPMIFGQKNICVGDIGVSAYNVYRQILVGAKAAKTKYIVCCEDDCLYTKEHMNARSDDGTVLFNRNKWNVNDLQYFYIKNVVMGMVIAQRDLIIAALEKRFEKYPEPPPAGSGTNFGEVGRCEKHLDLPLIPAVAYNTTVPSIMFSHQYGMGGRRKVQKRFGKSMNLEHWGPPAELWKKYFGTGRQ